MAMWSEILGGLGAAGGGYAQALERVKMQNLDEKTQREQQAWRDEESQRRTSEEQARIAADLKRDRMTEIRRAQEDAQAAEDRYHARLERERREEHDITEAEENRLSRERTLEFQRGQTLAGQEALAAERPPENHAIVSGRGALERTKNEDDGSWNPAAAKQYLEEQYQGDVALPELIRGLNHVLVIEMERDQDTFEPLGLEEVYALTAQGRREYEERLARFQSGSDRQTIGWGDRMPPPEITGDSTGPGEVLRNLADTTGIQFDQPPPLPVDTVGVGPVDPVRVGPVDPVGVVPTGVPIAGITPSVEQTPYNEMFGSNPSRSTNLRGTLTSRNLPATDTTAVPDLSREEAQRELDELMRRIGR